VLALLKMGVMTETWGSDCINLFQRQR